MRKVKFSKLREEFATILDAVSNDRETIEITRRNKSSVVIVDKREYESMLETLHLLSTAANARALFEAIEAVNEGKYELHDLIEVR